ncbi:MAG: DUF4835 family protein [Bacteroidales bacterium]|nr:DUF4835 family protein [Bacteroidales bacterium]
MRKCFLIIIFVFVCIVNTHAQDILASISVSASRVDGTDRTVYDAMQKSLTEMVNGRSWTPYQLKPDERFRIRMSINITNRISDTEFDGTITLVMGRIVFNSNYESPVLNIMDNNLHFYYNQYEPLEYIENVYTNNLTSVVAFYIYYALGIQFDTFQASGGQEFYERANNIVQSAQSSNETGWKTQDGDKSRYRILEYIMSPTYRSLRTFLYQYHRQGLDIMADNVENGRTQIIRGLEELKRAYLERPGMYATQIMIDVKRDEVINIFKQGSDNEKNTVSDLMKQIDITNSSKYDAMKSSGSTAGGTNYPGSGTNRDYGTGTGGNSGFGGSGTKY